MTCGGLRIRCSSTAIAPPRGSRARPASPGPRLRSEVRHESPHRKSLSAGARRSRGLAGLLSLSALFLCLGSSVAQAGPVQTDWKKIKTPPLREFKPQQPNRIQLDNGLTIYLQPNPELPLITVLGSVVGGSRDEPADKVGLSSLYAQTLRSGGTKSKTGDQVDDFLAARAAMVRWDDEVDSVNLMANFHKADFDDVERGDRMLAAPQFQQDKLDLAKRQLTTGISRRNDDPMDIADREAEKLALGATHPHARQAEYATVASVTRGSGGLAPRPRAPQQHDAGHRRRLRSSGDDRQATVAVWRLAAQAAGAAYQHPVCADQAGPVLRQQRRRQPEQHPPGTAGHDAQEP